MSTQTKKVLTIGLGQGSAPAKPSHLALAPNKEALREVVVKQVQAAKDELGIEMDLMLVNESEFGQALETVKEKLKTTQYDGISIGNGIRGTDEYTVFFEDLMNICREMAPKTRQVFNKNPGDVFEAMERNFGKK